PLLSLDLEPGVAALARPVGGVEALGDRALEAARDRLLGEPAAFARDTLAEHDTVITERQHALTQSFAARGQRLVEDRFEAVVEQVEGDVERGRAARRCPALAREQALEVRDPVLLDHYLAVCERPGLQSAQHHLFDDACVVPRAASARHTDIL